jgi:D-beta-D-heptose 7-phosphate kinase/D-beta-D-heptose 1-phosphate adenosyltransferase
MNKKTIVVSGGFDPLHVGHLRMMQEASQHGKLTVIINSDEWLFRKKGYVFMPWAERAEIIKAYDFVAEVIEAKDEDKTVVKSLEEIRPDIFANGGDRGNTNTPETRFCKENNIEMIWNVGGGKIQSSSTMVKEVTQKKRTKDLENYRRQIAF